MKTLETTVFIVGAGPTGLAATCLLATQGIDTLTITRYPGTANSPRAHITNQRTMEVFRDLGIEDRIRAVSTPNELMGNNVWATSFAGTEIARLETWGTSPERKRDYERASPSSMCNVPQHLMEPVLLDVARERGARFLFNTELVSMTQDAGGVTSICRDRLTGESIRVRSRYAIGADAFAKKLEAEEKKMAAGMGQTFFVFQAQRDLSLARTAEIQAISSPAYCTSSAQAARSSAASSASAWSACPLRCRSWWRSCR